MKVLILGRGYLGTQLYLYLKDKMATTILSKADLDYTDPGALSSYIFSERFKVVINASGFTGKPNIDAAETNKEDCWKYNVDVPLAIADAAQRAGAFMIHLSSGCIYNGYEKVFTEEDPPNWGIFQDDSSFYSKTKHVAERLLANKAWLLRLRMPFSGDLSERNYFTKILNYNKLISLENSVTSVDDFCELVKNMVVKISEGVFMVACSYGPINCVNEGTLNAKEVVEMMKKYDLVNPNHQFIELSELKTLAARSNCVLSTHRLKELGLTMPDAKLSAELAIKRMAGKA